MYKRVLLKLSGEALAGDNRNGISPKVVDDICSKVKKVTENGTQVAIVVGGGNFWRSKDGYDIERTTSDYMGMLATVINALAVKDGLEAKGVKAVVQTAISMPTVAEPYTKRDAEKHLNSGEVIVFGGGIGHPYFSTDTTAALRASEIGADVILVGKTIDGIYSDDPKKNPNAVKYDEITYSEILKQNLKAMDSTATSICMDNNIPLVVFDLYNSENIIKAANGEKIGTLVK